MAVRGTALSATLSKSLLTVQRRLLNVVFVEDRIKGYFINHNDYFQT